MKFDLEDESKIKEINEIVKIKKSDNWFCININIAKITLIEYILNLAWSYPSAELYGGAIVDLVLRRNAIREFISQSPYNKFLRIEEIFNPEIDPINWKQRSILPRDIDLFFYDQQELVLYLREIIKKNVSISTCNKNNNKEFWKLLYDPNSNLQEYLNKFSRNLYHSSSYYAEKILRTFSFKFEMNPLALFHNIGMNYSARTNSIIVNVDITFSIIDIKDKIERKYIAPYPNYIKTLSIKSFKELDDIHLVNIIKQRKTRSTLSDFLEFEPLLKKFCEDNNIAVENNINLKVYLNRLKTEQNNGWIFDDIKINNNNLSLQKSAKIGFCNKYKCSKCSLNENLVLSKDNLNFNFCDNKVTFIFNNNYIKIDIDKNIMNGKYNDIIIQLNLEQPLPDTFIQLIFNLNTLFILPDNQILNFKKFINYYNDIRDKYLQSL